jgi:hypothetical protein
MTGMAEQRSAQQALLQCATLDSDQMRGARVLMNAYLVSYDD